MYDIAVIGAGASGLAAAINAKRTNSKLNIILLEALPRVGKKILATGNGRCNLTNLNASVSDYNDKFVSDVLNTFPPQKVIDFFRSIGLVCTSDSEGRAYPSSNTAASVLDCLRFEAEKFGVEVICDFHADEIINKKNYFLINNSVSAKKIILATGGKSSPAQGSDGSGYTLLKKLGHTVTPLYPALVQLTVGENVKSLKGVRVKANVTLISDKNVIDSSKGEVLFTDYGLSGISVMDISRSVKNKKCICRLDILPCMNTDEIKAFLDERRKQNPELSAENALSGILPKKAGQYVLKVCGIHSDKPLKAVNEFNIKSVAQAIKSLDFTVTGSNGFKNAQITAGGVELSEFDSRTLESKKINNLFCTGELLNIDSICGGYNLQWAWASGLTAGFYSASNS